MTNPIHVIRSLDGPALAVFDAWVSPATVIGPVTSVEMDPVVGGAVALSVGDDATGGLRGRFLEVDRPRRLRYTWRWGGSAEETIITVRFNDLGSATVVEVDHTGFLDDASRTTHLTGWVDYLDALPAFL